MNDTRPENYTSDDFTTLPLDVPYTVFEVLVAAGAVIGNALVIIVFYRERRLRRRTNYYIVSLAVADLLVGLFGIPAAILAKLGLPRNLHGCLFTVSLLVVLCTISIFSLVAVSVDRYWAILHPMDYSRNVRTKTAVGIIIICWLSGAAVGFLPLFGVHAGGMKTELCIFTEVMDYNYLVFLYFATIIIPAAVLACFYAHIYTVVIKQLRHIVTMNPSSNGRHVGGGSGNMLRVFGAAQKREVKATQNLAFIVLFFVICWVPLYTINFINAVCKTCTIHQTITDFCIILSHFNSAGNPLLYAYHLRDFRAALKHLIYKLFCIETENPLNTRNDFNTIRPTTGSLPQGLNTGSFNSLRGLVCQQRGSLSSIRNKNIYINHPVLRERSSLQNETYFSAPNLCMNGACKTPDSNDGTENEQHPTRNRIWTLTEMSSEADSTAAAQNNGSTNTIHPSEVSVGEINCSFVQDRPPDTVDRPSTATSESCDCESEKFAEVAGTLDRGRRKRATPAARSHSFPLTHAENNRHWRDRRWTTPTRENCFAQDENVVDVNDKITLSPRNLPYSITKRSSASGDDRRQDSG